MVVARSTVDPVDSATRRAAPDPCALGLPARIVQRLEFIT
jgi:hypothetical protein